MAFVTDIPVHFADVDHAQVVYYPRFFDFFHRAFEAFLRAQGHSLRHIIDVDGVGLPVVHAEADYRAPLRCGALLRLTLQAEQVKERSVVLGYRGQVEDGTLVVVGQEVRVCVQLPDFQTQAWPAHCRALWLCLLQKDHEDGLGTP